MTFIPIAASVISFIEVPQRNGVCSRNATVWRISLVCRQGGVCGRGDFLTYALSLRLPCNMNKIKKIKNIGPVQPLSKSSLALIFLILLSTFHSRIVSTRNDLEWTGGPSTQSRLGGCVLSSTDSRRLRMTFSPVTGGRSLILPGMLLFLFNTMVVRFEYCGVGIVTNMEDTSIQDRVIWTLP